MPEEKPAVEGQDKGKETKSVENVIAEIRIENEKLTKMVNDSQTMINRQAGEIGELRKKVNPKPQESEDKDELVEEIYEDLRKDGLDEETAHYNAKILMKSGVMVIDKKLNERMMSEVVDLVEEAIEERKIDGKIFEENETEIMSEFKSRKLAPTARKNYKILRDCYDIITRRKADALRQENEKLEAEKRDKLIAEGNQPPSGKRSPVESDEDKKAVESIRLAGVKRDSAFF